jgi:hypothetical protein
MLNLCGIVAAILKMATGRNFSMSGINSGHHYLPTYQILMISDNVEFLVLYNLKVFCSDSLTLDPMGKMFQNASSTLSDIIKI